MLTLERVLLLAFVVQLWVTDSDAEGTTWPQKTCKFDTFEGLFSHTKRHRVRGLDSQKACEADCESNPHCGIYVWSTFRGRNICSAYPFSLGLLERAGIEASALRRPDRFAKSILGSKTCEAHLSENKTCKKFKAHDRKKISGGGYSLNFLSLSKNALKPGKLSAENCQKLCSFYDECASVLHYIHSRGASACFMYSTTVTELESKSATSGHAKACEDFYTTCATYDKQCKE